LRLFFFFSLSLPLMRQQPNYTCMLKTLLKLYCIWTWDTLWGFFVLCGSVLFYFSPLMRQLQNNIWGTISRIWGWGMSTKIIKTEILLHLNLQMFLFLLFIYLFTFNLYTYIFFRLFIFLFSILSLSL
jgi:hypothetical protein